MYIRSALEFLISSAIRVTSRLGNRLVNSEPGPTVIMSAARMACRTAPTAGNSGGRVLAGGLDCLCTRWRTHLGRAFPSCSSASNRTSCSVEGVYLAADG